MVLNATEIRELIDRGVIQNCGYDLVNASSLDITLGNNVLMELNYDSKVTLRGKESLDMRKITLMNDESFLVEPGEFILACSREIFNLPNDICAEYKLKSSLGRIGFNHLNAGWCDPGWHGSVLTLEFNNTTRYHTIEIRPGDRIGQIVFFRINAVSEEDSYASKGRYNGDLTATGVKR